MGNLNNKTTSTLFALILSLLLISTPVESRAVFPFGAVKSEATINCSKSVGVKSGDTCSVIAQTFKLSTAEFDAFNPNLNCVTLFVGQWLCVNGAVGA